MEKLAAVFGITVSLSLFGSCAEPLDDGLDLGGDFPADDFRDSRAKGDDGSSLQEPELEPAFVDLLATPEDLAAPVRSAELAAEAKSLYPGLAPHQIEFVRQKLAGDWDRVGVERTDLIENQADVRFTEVSKQACEGLRAFLSGPAVWGVRSGRICAEGSSSYLLSELVPQAQQALRGHRLQSVAQIVEGNPVLLIQNCWSTAYEVTRLALSGDDNFTVFNVGAREIESVFGDQALFTTLAEAQMAPGDYLDAWKTILETALPGDLLLLYTPERLTHTVVIAGPGIAFEKTGATSLYAYRHVLLEDVLELWSVKIDRAVVKRPTGARLPSPASFRTPGKEALGEPVYFDTETVGIPRYLIWGIDSFQAGEQAALPANAHRADAFTIGVAHNNVDLE